MTVRSAQKWGRRREGAPAWQRVMEARYFPVAFLLVLAAATRFLLLGHQSLWFDEIVSLKLARQPFLAMLHDLVRTESTPPLYYVLLWVWVRLLGTSAEALRSLSACLGVLTVGVLYLTARLRFSSAAAFAAGALAATNPMLIWYSQEARAYGLVTFFVACSLYFMLRLPGGGTRALAGWSVAVCLALASHYFAVFAFVPESAYVLYIFRRRLRPAVLALLGPLAVETALMPLAIHQRNSGHTAYIATSPLGTRTAGTLDWFLLGPYGLSHLHVLALCLAGVVAMTLSIAWWGSRAVQRNALLLAGVALATFVLPLLTVPGSFRDKNLIVALPPLLLVAGAALAPGRARLSAMAAALVVAAGLLMPTVLAAQRLNMQREDWRGMATLIGPPNRTQVVVAYPRFEYLPLRYYRPDLEPATRGQIHVREIVVVGRVGLDTLHFPPGFRRGDDERLGSLRILRLRARTVRTVDVAGLHLRPVLRLEQGFRSVLHPSNQDATLLIEQGVSSSTGK